MRRRLARLATGEDIDFFCLNDVDTAPAARSAAQATIRTFLERKYPFPSRFEGAARAVSRPVATLRASVPPQPGRKHSFAIDAARIGVVSFDFRRSQSLV
jgi:hypothetical protein